MTNREKYVEQTKDIEFSRYFVVSTVAKLQAEAQRKEEKKMKKKTVVKFALAAACFALALVVGINAFPVNKAPESVNKGFPSTVEQTANKAPGFTLLLASAAETEDTANVSVAIEHKSDITLPVNGLIVTKDVSGLSAEEQAREQEALFRGLQSKIDHENFATRGGIVSDLAYYTVINRNFAVKAEQPELLKDIVIRCENGKSITGNCIALYLETKDPTAMVARKEITVSAEEYARYHANGLILKWAVSEQMIEEIAAADAPSYADISDTVTVTLNYTDGTSESFQIHINFDEAGNLTATYTE